MSDLEARVTCVLAEEEVDLTLGKASHRCFPILNRKSPFHMVLLISNQTRVFGPLRETSCSKAGEGYQCSERGNSGDGVENFGSP